MSSNAAACIVSHVFSQLALELVDVAENLSCSSSSCARENASSVEAVANANAMDPRLVGGGAEELQTGESTWRAEALRAEDDDECVPGNTIAGGAEYCDSSAATPLDSDDNVPPPAEDTPVAWNGSLRLGMLVTKTLGDLVIIMHGGGID